MNANSGNFCFGFSEILVLLPANNASDIFISHSRSNQSAKIGKTIYKLPEIYLKISYSEKCVRINKIHVEKIKEKADFLLNL